MEKIIERNVPIAEENVTLSGQPATNMFEDWSENITETDLLHEEKDKGLSPKKNLNPEKPDVPLNKNDAFQKVQKRRVQEKR